VGKNRCFWFKLVTFELEQELEPDYIFLKNWTWNWFLVERGINFKSKYSFAYLQSTNLLSLEIRYGTTNELFLGLILSFEYFFANVLSLEVKLQNKQLKRFLD
jgi:hypothetical protein